MSTRKILLAGVVLAAALVFTVIRHGSTAADRTSGSALAHANSHQSTVVVPNPIIPADVAHGEHGWGPARSTDW